jgi:hypothetical protein
LAGARKNCRAKLAAAVWMDGCWAMLDAGWTLAGASIVANKISDPTSSSESYHYLPRLLITLLLLYCCFLPRDDIIQYFYCSAFSSHEKPQKAPIEKALPVAEFPEHRNLRVHV